MKTSSDPADEEDVERDGLLLLLSCPSPRVCAFPQALRGPCVRNGRKDSPESAGTGRVRSVTGRACGRGRSYHSQPRPRGELTPRGGEGLRPPLLTSGNVQCSAKVHPSHSPRRGTLAHRRPREGRHASMVQRHRRGESRLPRGAKRRPTRRPRPAPRVAPALTSRGRAGPST